MAILDSTHIYLGEGLSGYQEPTEQQAEIIPFPLNQDLVLGDYGGQTVYGLGKKALVVNHWLGVVRRGGFHLVFTDVQRSGGTFTEAITKQLVLADELAVDNPTFVATLDEDIEQTKLLMSEGYLMPDRAVVDYIWLGCMEAKTNRRMVLHPDSKNEHVAPQVREHTLKVVRVLTDIY